MTPHGRQGIMTGVLGEATIRELEIGLAGSVMGPGTRTTRRPVASGTTRSTNGPH